MGWTAIAYAAGPITLGHLWYYQIVRVVGAGRTAAFMNLMPFLVIAASWLFLGEPIHWPKGRRGSGQEGTRYRAAAVQSSNASPTVPSPLRIQCSRPHCVRRTRASRSASGAGSSSRLLTGIITNNV